MMMNKVSSRSTAIGLLMATLALSGCVAPMEVTQAPVSAAYKSGFSQDRIAGSSKVTVRTYTGTGKDKRELGGAKCVAESDELRAAFTTPADVVVPSFRQRKEFAHRGRPSQMRIVCKMGDKTGIVSFDASDKEVQTATNAGVGGAILTALVTGAIASSSPWRYPSQIVVQIDDVK